MKVNSQIEAAIKRDLDAIRETLPPNEQAIFDAEREEHRQTILRYVSEHGHYPDIGGVKRNEEVSIQ